MARVVNGRIKVSEEICYGQPDQDYKKAKISELFMFNNMGRIKVAKLQNS
jgi:predicted membrane GTPase involved in stress response